MKSLKYSSLSKIKKQKQQGKAQSSILNTLKQDDQICSNLLDTLSEDYLGYLEDLMGKKLVQQQKHQKQNQQNQKIIFRKEDTSSNLIKQHQETVSQVDKQFQQIFQNSKQKALLKQAQRVINEKIYSIKSKQRKQSNKTKEIKQTEQNKQAKQTNHAKETQQNECINNHSQIFSKQQQNKSIVFDNQKKTAKQKKCKGQDQNEQTKINKQFQNFQKQKNNQEIQNPQKLREKQINKIKSQQCCDGKVLIKNIEGYLQSLSGIKCFKQINLTQQSFKNQKKQIQNRQLEALAIQRQNMKKQNIKNMRDKYYKSKSQKNKFQLVQSSNYINQKKQIHPSMLKKDKTFINQQKQDQIKRYTKYLKKHQPMSADQNLPNDADYQSVDDEDSSYEQLSQQIQEIKKVKQSQKSMFNKKKIANANKVKKSFNYENKQKANQSAFKIEKDRNNNSLQQLLIKIITKYNKLLSKQNKYKQKVKFLSRQCLRLQQLNQFKDFQIQNIKTSRAKQKKSYQKNQYAVDKHDKPDKVQKKRTKNSSFSKSNTINFDQLQFLKQSQDKISNYRPQEHQKIYKDQFDERHNVNKKARQLSGKTINIQKMFVIDNLSMKKPNNHSNRQTRCNKANSIDCLAQKNQINKSRDFFSITLKNTTQPKAQLQKAKRSVSCREMNKKNDLNLNIATELELYDSKVKVEQHNRNLIGQTRYQKMNRNKLHLYLKNNQAQKQIDEVNFNYSNDMFDPKIRKIEQSSNKKLNYNGMKKFGQYQNQQKLKVNEVTKMEIKMEVQRNKKLYDTKSRQMQTKNTQNLNQKYQNLMNSNIIRNRAFSQSYNSISFKRRQSINDMKIKSFENQYNFSQALLLKKDRVINFKETGEASSQTSEETQEVKSSLKYFTKGKRSSGRQNPKPKQNIFNEESEQTDTQLLQKLLSMKKQKNQKNSSVVRAFFK